MPARHDSGLGRPLVWAAATIACVALESLAGLDRLVQNIFFQHGEWLISRSMHTACKAWLYTGPKVAIALIAAAGLLVFASPFIFPKTIDKLAPWQRPALLALLSICIIPLLAAGGKAVSGVWGPLDTLPYGGEHPHRGLLMQLWLYGRPAGGHSFPAGHASGGFALMALYYLPLTRRWRSRLLLLGFAFGWGMGLYQMARGEHFLSHTLTIQCLSLWVITALAQRLGLQASACRPFSFNNEDATYSGIVTICYPETAHGYVENSICLKDEAVFINLRLLNFFHASERICLISLSTKSGCSGCAAWLVWPRYFWPSTWPPA